MLPQRQQDTGNTEDLQTDPYSCFSDLSLDSVKLVLHSGKSPIPSIRLNTNLEFKYSFGHYVRKVIN